AKLSYRYQRKSSLYRNYMNEESWYVRNTVLEYYRKNTGTFPVPPGGMLMARRSSFTSNAGRAQLNYFKRFEDHRIRILGGINVRRNYFESQPYGFYGFDPQSLTHITNIDYQNGYNPKLHGDSDFRGGQIPPIPTLPSTSIRIRGRDDRYVS